MIRGKMGNQEIDSEDEDWAFSNCWESTASLDPGCTWIAILSFFSFFN
jgi:hypothetical protein